MAQLVRHVRHLTWYRKQNKCRGDVITLEKTGSTSFIKFIRIQKQTNE